MTVNGLSPARHQRTSQTPIGSFQCINSSSQCLLVWFHVPPNITIGFMPGCLLGILDPFGFCKLPEEGMPEDVGTHRNPLLPRQVRIRLALHPLQYLIHLFAAEPLPARGEKER